VTPRPIEGLRRSAARGVTLVQLLVTVAIVGVLGTLSVGGYRVYAERARVAKAVGDLGRIEVAIKRFAVERRGDLPASLADIGFGGAVDPWGSDYRYVNLDGGAPRTDHVGAAVNSDYDLYSLGTDRDTAPELTAAESRDDVIRGSDGAFLGLVSEYSRLP
jgi:general secretion pathway protein G